MTTNQESNAALLLAAVRQITMRVSTVEDQLLVLSTDMEQRGIEIDQLKTAVDMLRSELVTLKAMLPK
ncbi:MAG: hypothetical protein WC505_06155 [Patescibacteria group bacterium]